MAAALRHAFLRNFILALKLYGLGFRDMNFLERRVAIKRAADIALASAPGDAVWKYTLINSISRVYPEGNIMKSSDMLNNRRSAMAGSKKIGKKQSVKEMQHSSEKAIKQKDSHSSYHRKRNKQTNQEVEEYRSRRKICRNNLPPE